MNLLRVLFLSFWLVISWNMLKSCRGYHTSYTDQNFNPYRDGIPPIPPVPRWDAPWPDPEEEVGHKYPDLWE